MFAAPSSTLHSMPSSPTSKVPYELRYIREIWVHFQGRNTFKWIAFRSAPRPKKRSTTNSCPRSLVFQVNANKGSLSSGWLQGVLPVSIQFCSSQHHHWQPDCVRLPIGEVPILWKRIHGDTSQGKQLMVHLPFFLCWPQPLSAQGAISFLADNATHPDFWPPVIPEYANHTEHMAYLYVTDFVMNSGFDAAFQADRLSYSITEDMVSGSNATWSRPPDPWLLTLSPTGAGGDAGVAAYILLVYGLMHWCHLSDCKPTSLDPLFLSNHLQYGSSCFSWRRCTHHPWLGWTSTPQRPPLVTFLAMKSNSTPVARHSSTSPLRAQGWTFSPSTW